MAELGDLRFNIVANNQTAAAFAAVQAANDRMVGALRAGNQQMVGAMQASAGQVRSLGLQLTDITTDLVSGRSPLDILTHQGLRVAQLLGQSGVGTVGGAVATLKASFASLINPVSLATTAIIALAGVGIGWLAKAGGDTADLEAITDRHTESVKRLRDAYGEAALAQADMTEQERLTGLATTTRDLETATRAIAAEMRRMSSAANLPNFGFGGVGVPAGRMLEGLTIGFRNAAQAGTADAAAFKLQISTMMEEVANTAFDEAAQRVLDWIETLVEGQAGVKRLEAELALLHGTATEEQRALLGVAGATEEMNQVLKDHAALLRGAGGAARDFGGETAVLHFKLRGSMGGLVRLMNTEIADFTDAFGQDLAPAFGDAAAGLDGFIGPLNAMMATVAAGHSDILAFRAAVANYANLNPENEAIQAMARSILSMTEDAAQIQGAMNQGAAGIDTLAKAAADGKAPVDELAAALHRLRTIGSQPLGDKDQILADYEALIAAATTDAERAKLAADRDAALARIDPGNGLDFDPVKAHEAAARRSAAATAKETDAVGDLIAQLRLEQQMLGMSAVDQEVMNNLRRAGVDAASEYGQEIEALTRANAALEESQKRLNAAAEAFGDMLYTAFERIIIQGDNVKDVLADMLRLMAQMVLQAVLLGKGPLAGLFGGVGLFPAIRGAFGGARADGGPVDAGTMYEIGERGREFFIPSTNGRIIPGDRMGGRIAISPVYNIDARGATGEAAALIGAALQEHTRQLRKALPGWIQDAGRRGALN